MTIEIETQSGLFEGERFDLIFNEIIKSNVERYSFTEQIISIKKFYLEFDSLIDGFQNRIDKALDEAKEEYERDIEEDDSQALINDYRMAVI